MAIRQMQVLGQLPGREVRAAYVSDLALPYQIVERASLLQFELLHVYLVW